MITLEQLAEAIRTKEIKKAAEMIESFTYQQLENYRGKEGKSILTLINEADSEVLDDAIMDLILTPSKTTDSETDSSGLTSAKDRDTSPKFMVHQFDTSTTSSGTQIKGAQSAGKIPRDEKAIAEINVMNFIQRKLKEFCKGNHSEVAMSECDCPQMKREGGHSPRDAADAVAIEALTTTYPLEDFPTLNLVFVGEGRMLYSAHFIGLLNKLGYNVNATIIDQRYNTLSDAYIERYTPEETKREQERREAREKDIPFDRSHHSDPPLTYKQGHIKYLDIYRDALEQYKFILNELGKEFSVKNSLLGHFYTYEAYKGVLAGKSDYLHELWKRSADPHERAALSAYNLENFTGDYDQFRANYDTDAQRAVQGVFLIDVVHKQENAKALIENLPRVLKEQAILFMSAEPKPGAEKHTTKAYEAVRQPAQVDYSDLREPEVTLHEVTFRRSPMPRTRD